MCFLCLSKFQLPFFIFLVVLALEKNYLISQLFYSLLMLQSRQQLVLSKILLKSLDFKFLICKLRLCLRHILSIIEVFFICKRDSILISLNRQMLRNIYTVAFQEGSQLLNNENCLGIIFEGECLSGRRRPIFFFRATIPKHVVVIINNFSHKMSSHYDRRSLDKENSYDHSSYPSNTPKQASISNDQLRRKLDHNLALMEKNPTNTNEDEHENYKPSSDYSNIKRDNARRRGFDLKVSNIDSINDKITGLLSMVRKDKQRQIMEAQPRQRPEACKTPNPGLVDRVKQTNANNGERYTPTLDKNVSSFVDVSARDRKRGTYNLEDSVEFKRNDLDHFERKIKLRSKIQEQDNSTNPIYFDRSGKQRESSWLNVQHKQSPLREIKNYAYKEDNTARKQLADQKKHFDTMLEQRRKQRMMNRQNDRQKSETRLTNKSAIKHKYAYSQLEESINVNKRDSPIIKVCEQNFIYKQDGDEPFVRIKTPSPKKQSPRARDKDRFSQIAYLEEGGQKREKINTAARLIDQQLLRIKSKITESETNQKRLQTSYKPRVNAEPSRTKEHIIRIAESISTQVKFDTNLKPAREAFDAIEGQQKWHELEQKLSVKGLRLSKNSIKQMMKIGPDEHNPFGGAKKSFDIQELIELIVAAEKNWENSTLKCASARALKSENFEVSDLDLHNKGYLGLEDLVCFVNLYSNTFYRNRDMVLVMRRLQLLEGSQGVSGICHDTFLNAFSA